MVAALDLVQDAGGANEMTELAKVADRMGELVAEYEDEDEDEHYPEIPERRGV